MASQKSVEEVREIFLQAADIVKDIAPPLEVDAGLDSCKIDLGQSITFAAKSHMIVKVMDELIRRDVFEQSNQTVPKAPRTL